MLLALDARLVDLDRPETLSAALEGVDLVISSIEDREARAERHIVRHGGVLLSQATLRPSARHLVAADAGRSPAGTVILNSGFSGVGALVIKHLLGQHPDSDAIELAYVVSTGGSSGISGACYAHRLLTGMARVKSKVLRFTPPHGPRRCFDLSHNDEAWLSPALRGDRSVHAYLAIAERGVTHGQVSFVPVSIDVATHTHGGASHRHAHAHPKI